jgi:glycosyltransferase involved in cell wall biosynthesis
VRDALASFHVGARLDVFIALALSLAILFLFVRSRSHQLKVPRLTPVGPSQSDGLPDCMVVIPARDEQGFIGRAVASLPQDSVIVVDDFSSDGTAEEARKAGAGVIKASKLSRSASGKSNACVTGARALKSKWILFTDADTRFEPGFLDAVTVCAEAGSVGFLSIYLDAEYGNVWERVMGPYLAALFFCGSNPGSDTPAAFNGQCILVRREAYEFLGGHSAVINDLNEDVRLAALAKRHRLKFGIVRASGLGRARWRDLSGMVERGAFRFMVVAPVPGTTVLIASAVMAAWIPVLAWLLSHHEYRAAAAFTALPFLLLWRWYPRGAASLFALTIPIAIYGALPLLFRGLWGALSGGASQWKGRRI